MIYVRCDRHDKRAAKEAERMAEQESELSKERRWIWVAQSARIPNIVSKIDCSSVIVIDECGTVQTFCFVAIRINEK